MWVHNIVEHLIHILILNSIWKDKPTIQRSFKELYRVSIFYNKSKYWSLLLTNIMLPLLVNYSQCLCQNVWMIRHLIIAYCLAFS